MIRTQSFVAAGQVQQLSLDQNMTGFHADVGSGRAPPRTRTRLEDHPVYAVLPQKVQVGLTESARRLSLEAGEAPPSNALYFVLNGALGFFPSDQRICVGVVPPGSVLGWEGAIGVTIEAHNTRAILPTVGYIAPLRSVRTLLKSTWIHQFLAAYAASRARALGVEAACNARHTALQRLAKWIARLHAADGEERGISITQGELADMLGLQRTSVNAACRHLQDRGALRIRRARLVVLDQEELSQAACDCDAALADGAAEQRLRNRLN
ncbi:Crp/Fnr family transcriptional regulator [Brevundimonas diminuta]|uniref:Crp/Fnr family transcriptional regulator n=1 Tax=Brevundimonas diminuta TaxID=293 RepID=UPI000DD8A506|nr:Crp/Fnr family transcriptional regulator [Brevundimonas diminuta]